MGLIDFRAFGASDETLRSDSGTYVMFLPTASTFPEPPPTHIRVNKHHQNILKVHDRSHTDTAWLLLSFPSVWEEKPRAAGPTRHNAHRSSPQTSGLVSSGFVCQLLQHRGKISKNQTHIQTFSCWGRCVGVTAHTGGGRPGVLRQMHVHHRRSV